MLTKSQIIEIILRQYPSVPPGMHEQMMKMNNRIIVQQARRAGLDVFTRNQIFYLNQKLS